MIMILSILIVVAAVASVAVVCLSVALVRRGKAIEDLKAQNYSLQSENTILSTRLEDSKKNAAEMLANREQMQRESREAFENIAKSIMFQQSTKLGEQNRESLTQLFTPLRDNLGQMEQAIRRYHESGLSNVASLTTLVKDLNTANDALCKEAGELTRALKGDNRMQGDWGEMVLKRLLETSGLKEGENFSLQYTVGNKRPDAVLFMPDERAIVIDSKNSVTAYTEMVNATTEAERSAALVRHRESVRKHVTELADKEYFKCVQNSADFVLMFMPNEGAYMAAMNADPKLWQYAYDRNVLIVSPAHLVVVLRLMWQLWSREKQDKNILKIVNLAEKLVSKFGGIVEALNTLGDGLKSAQNSYEKALDRIVEGKGNVSSIVNKIVDLGGIDTSRSKPLKLKYAQEQTDEPEVEEVNSEESGNLGGV